MIGTLTSLQNRFYLMYINLGNTNEEKNLSGEDRVKLTALAAFLCSCLEKSGFFDEINTAPTQDDVALLIEKYLLGIITKPDTVQSVYYSEGSVDKSNLWEMSRIPIKEFALAVYPDFATSRCIQKTKELNIADEKSDVMLGYHKGALFLQSLQNFKSGHLMNLQNIVGAGCAFHTARKAAIPIQLANMTSYKCVGTNCSLSFPLPEKTSENIIVCPLDECGAETNIWSHRKRIVELRRDHEAARGKIEGISGTGGVKGIDEGVKILKGLIDEWDEFVSRPNKDITCLEQDLTKALLLKHIESEQEYRNKKW